MRPDQSHYDPRPTPIIKLPDGTTHKVYLPAEILGAEAGWVEGVDIKTQYTPWDFMRRPLIRFLIIAVGRSSRPWRAPLFGWASRNGACAAAIPSPTACIEDRCMPTLNHQRNRDRSRARAHRSCRPASSWASRCRVSAITSACRCPANCRMCLVEMKGSPKPVASCAMPGRRQDGNLHRYAAGA